MSASEFKLGRTVEGLVYAVVLENKAGISAINVQRQLKREGNSITREQVSGALQRLRKSGLVSHFGGWTPIKLENV